MNKSDKGEQVNNIRLKIMVEYRIIKMQNSWQSVGTHRIKNNWLDVNLICTYIKKYLRK